MADVLVPDSPGRRAKPKLLSIIRNVVKSSHRELSGKYQIHGPGLRELWHGMGEAQRKTIMEPITSTSISLESRQIPGASMETLAPEWNLKDITTAGSDFLLRILEYRATTSLTSQYCSGDHEFIFEQIRTQNLPQVESVPDCYMSFLGGEAYGRSVTICKDETMSLGDWETMMEVGLYIPDSVGRFVLARQYYLLTLLCAMVESILSYAMETAVSKLLVQPSIPALHIQDALDSALEQRDCLEDDLVLIRMESVALRYSLITWFRSRPELVADERGRKSPATDPKLIGATFLDVIHNAVKGLTIWTYLCLLLELLRDISTDQSHRRIVLREITNVCHLEYSRLQRILKYRMSIKLGISWFKRISNSYENGHARIILKDKPEVLARGDQQFYCMLRLCQAEVTAPKAVDWLVKLSKMHNNDPSLRERLQRGEAEALDGLYGLASFIQPLSQATHLPPVNRKHGQRFVTRVMELEAELNKVKSELDFSHLTFPFKELEEPGNANAALKAFDEFMINKMGGKIELLYQEGLIYTSYIELQEELAVQAQHEAAKKTIKTEYIPFPQESPAAPEVCIQEKRKKEKTRPAHSSGYEISLNSEAIPTVTPPASPSKPFTVKPATAEVFSTLFSHAESRGSIAWANFEAALAELNFAVLPKLGSAHTFVPPESMAIQKPITFHRPHKSRIEGNVLLIIAHRLNRLYGWSESTFQVA